jgi:hypothetical protein
MRGVPSGNLLKNWRTPMTEDRKILFKSDPPSDNLNHIVNTFIGNSTPLNDVPEKPQFFLRLNKLADVMQGDSISPTAFLAGPPVVFLTLPETIKGLNHMDTLFKVGYSARDIRNSGLHDTPMVAIIFRYPVDVQFSNNLKESSLSWQKSIFPTTWDNIFQVFENVAEEATVAAERVNHDRYMSRDHQQLIFKSERDKKFVCSYPEWGKGRMKGEPYQSISRGGADWYYRCLLQHGLDLTERFSGNGRTSPEVAHLDDAPEYSGPNYSLRLLASESEMAIVKL